MNRILLAADEIFTNIADYGYPDGNGNVNVAVKFDEENSVFALTFTDFGIPYNPLAAPTPDTNKPLRERKVGGLGIFIVKKIMDEISYRREYDSNILILKKHIKKSDESASGLQ